MEDWKKEAWSRESLFLRRVDGHVHACRLPGKEMAPGSSLGVRFIETTPHNFQGSAAVLEPDPRGHLQMSCGVQASVRCWVILETEREQHSTRLIGLSLSYKSVWGQHGRYLGLRYVFFFFFMKLAPGKNNQRSKRLNHTEFVSNVLTDMRQSWVEVGKQQLCGSLFVLSAHCVLLCEGFVSETTWRCASECGGSPLVSSSVWWKTHGSSQDDDDATADCATLAKQMKFIMRHWLRSSSVSSVCVRSCSTAVSWPQGKGSSHVLRRNVHGRVVRKWEKAPRNIFSSLCNRFLSLCRCLTLILWSIHDHCMSIITLCIHYWRWSTVCQKYFNFQPKKSSFYFILF